MKRLYFIFVIIGGILSLYVYKNFIYKKETIKQVSDVEVVPVSKSENVYDPVVYIYNTHQKESYAEDYLSFSPSVLDAAYTLRDYLEEKKVQVLVENADFYDFLALNNWNYNSLYKVSRLYMEDAMKRYKNIRLYIDLHRDSIKHDLATTTINDKPYAKVLFVVGISHENYKDNLKLAKELNSLIVKKANISRGILQKSSASANGIYNQDLSDKVVLIEVGGYQSNYNEVDNTLRLLASAIKEYLDE